MTGGGNGGDLHISKEALADVTKGLNAAMDELGQVGSASGASRGSGFADLELSQLEAGTWELNKAFEGFCDRWEWGVRALIEDANALAERLDLAAGEVWREDEYQQGTFKYVVNSGIGNPHLDEDTVTDRRMGYGDIMAQWTSGDERSSEEVRQDITQPWKEAGAVGWSKDSATGGPLDQYLEAGGLSDEQRDGMREHMEKQAEAGREAQADRDAEHQRRVWNGGED
ncbi:hypothetical protein [Streptomyces sp. ODS28]|uniref:hypothetical protein n=1 Tax=Streptomyces sp. ODS28 TaxID=3136688 RepID=UPI0031ED5789